MKFKAKKKIKSEIEDKETWKYKHREFDVKRVGMRMELHMNSLNSIALAVVSRIYICIKNKFDISVFKGL